MYKATRFYRVFAGAFAVVLVMAAGCFQKPSPTPPPVPPPVVNPPLTETQTLGVDLMKTFQRDPRLAGASISVGTSSTTVTLDGQVSSAASKNAALQIARRNAPGFQILNRLVVAKTSAIPNANQARK